MSFSGSPVVKLYDFNEFTTYSGGNETLFAKNRRFPKNYEITWKKDNQKLNITDPKYKGSKHDDRRPVLHINNIKKEDEGTYTIEVNNELGKGQCSIKLVVAKGKIYLIY